MYKIFFLLNFYFIFKKIFLKIKILKIINKNNPIELFTKNLKKFHNLNINNFYLYQIKFNKYFLFINFKIKNLLDDFFIKKQYYYKYVKNWKFWKLKSINYKTINQYKI